MKICKIINIAFYNIENYYDARLFTRFKLYIPIT